MILDIVFHFVLFKYFKYVRFKGHSDEHHIDKTLNTLKNLYLNGNGLCKEINILGIRSKEQSIKSTAYFMNICHGVNDLNSIVKDKDLENLIPEAINEQSAIFNLCSLYFAAKANGYDTVMRKIESLAKQSFNKITISSTHIYLIKLRYDYHSGIIGLSDLAERTIDHLDNKTIEEVMKSNSFSVSKESTSHELAYFLNFTLDIYEDSQNKVILELLDEYIEKLHRLFVRYKTVYSNVIKKGDRISLSGSFLLAKLFLRYTLITGDYRFASAAFFLLDLGKHSQNINFNGLISNTFPVYKYGSPFKYPAWTQCYFVDALQLKIKVKNKLKDEFSLYV